MKLFSRRAFEKDADKLPVDIKIKLSYIFDEIVRAEKLSDIKNCRKLAGHKTAYLIKLNRFRVGFFFENNVIELVRVLDRKNIYKYFP